MPLVDIKMSLINRFAIPVQLVNLPLAVVVLYVPAAQWVPSLPTLVQQLAHLVLLVDMLMRQAKRFAGFAAPVSSLVESAMPCVRLAPQVSDQLCLKPELVQLVLPEALLLVRTM